MLWESGAKHNAAVPLSSNSQQLVQAKRRQWEAEAQQDRYATTSQVRHVSMLTGCGDMHAAGHLA